MKPQTSALLEPVLNAVPLLWLGFIAGCYLLLAALPINERTDSAPSSLDALDTHAAALLALVLLAGIIKCLGDRARRTRAAGEGGRRAGTEAGAVPGN